MARNGSGTYSLPAGNPVVTGTTISSTWANNTLSDIATALTASIAKDGQTPITANIPFSGYKLTGVGAATATGQAAIWDQLWDQGIEVALASAATTDLGAQTTNFVNITGTTTITSFGTTYKGPRFVRFAGALLLTHNASTLILPTGANITTAAGDSCVIVPKATSGTADGWKVEAYQKADGTALSLPAISQSNIAAGYGLIPTGTLLDFGGTSAPTGFLGCDGAAVSRTTYATLFTAIGTTWGVGDGSTTFNVPNFQRRVAVGSGGSGTATLANSVGSTGGAETHTLVTGEMPAHTHDLVGYVTGSNTGVGTTSVSVSGGVQGATNSTGGGGAHNNMQPSAVILKIIKT